MNSCFEGLEGRMGLNVYKLVQQCVQLSMLEQNLVIISNDSRPNNYYCHIQMPMYNNLVKNIVNPQKSSLHAFRLRYIFEKKS